MPHFSRRATLTGGAAAALTALGTTAAASTTGSASPADAVLDISHASPEAVKLVTSTFRDKTARDVGRFMAHFSQRQLTYTDGTLGAKYSTWPQLKAVFDAFMPTWPTTIRSYPTKILGDARSAMVLFVDSPEMFGNELRIIAPIDFRDGKIVREVDYWDGRHFGTAATEAIRMSPGQFATDFGESTVGEQSSAALQDVAAALSHAFATGDPAAAAALFTTDATFEDLTLHVSVTGRPAIQAFLTRSAGLLPYGLGTSVRHTVGSAQGGGYEWLRRGAPVDHGVVALELRRSRITRFTTVWDGSMVDDATLGALLTSTVEH